MKSNIKQPQKPSPLWTWTWAEAAFVTSRDYAVLWLEDVHSPHHVLPADGALTHPLATLCAGDHVTTLQKNTINGGVHADPAEVVIRNGHWTSFTIYRGQNRWGWTRVKEPDSHAQGGQQKVTVKVTNMKNKYRYILKVFQTVPGRFYPKLFRCSNDLSPMQP